eukprot:SAG25_NODE_917_length_4774_cov_6.141176_5_plen_81_part_00
MNRLFRRTKPALLIVSICTMAVRPTPWGMALPKSTVVARGTNKRKAKQRKHRTVHCQRVFELTLLIRQAAVLEQLHAVGG